MSEVLDYVREKDPRFKDVSDEDLTLFLGSKKPDFLKDPGFKEDFVKAAGEKSLGLALKGTGTVLKILNNPAVAEASAMGREQAQAQRLEAGINLATESTGKVIGMLEKGAAAAPSPEELAEQKAEIKRREDLQKMGPTQALASMRQALAKPAGEGSQVLTTPILHLAQALKPEVMLEAARQFTASSLRIPASSLGPHASKEDVDKAIKASPVLAAEVGTGQALAQLDESFTSLLGASTLGMGYLPAAAQRIVSLGFAAQMAKQEPEIFREVAKEYNQPPEKRDWQKLSNLVATGVFNTGFTIGGVLHGVAPVTAFADTALNKVRKVAPLTSDALEGQIGQQYAQAGPLAPPTRISERPQAPAGGAGVTEIPKPAETPQAEAAASASPPSIESGEPPPIEPEDEIMASAERTRIKEKGPSDARTKVQEPKTGGLPAEQREPVKPETKGEVEKGTALGRGEDQGQEIKPEVAKLEKNQTLNKLGDPIGTTYHATPEDWARWQELSKQMDALVKAKKYDDVFPIQKEMENIKNKYGGMPPAEPKAAEVKPAEPAKTISQPPKSPKYVKGQNFDEHMEAINDYEKAVEEWETKQPKNKPLIFQHDNRVVAITPDFNDPKYPWRATSFSNTDHMPIGHDVFKTRAEAVRAQHGAERIEKIPFQVEPLPIRAFPGDKVTWRRPDGTAVEVEFRGYSKEPGKAFIKDPETGEDRTIDSMELAPKMKTAAEVQLASDAQKIAEAKAEKEAAPIEVPKGADKQAANDLAAKANDLVGTRKLSAKEKSNLGKLIEQARAGDIAPLQTEIERIQNEAARQKQRSPTAINRDIKQVKANLRALRSAKRGYEKVKDKGAAARVQEKIQTAENKLSKLNQEYSQLGTVEDKRVGQAMRRFNRETLQNGPDILSQINEKRKLMSWSQFVDLAKTKGEEWFNQNKSEYDGIRNVKLPPHVNAAIFGGDALPNVVAKELMPEGSTADDLWKEVKQAANTRLGLTEGKSGEEKALEIEERQQVWKEATGPKEGRTEVDPSIVAPGERYMLDGQEIKVVARDTETGFITIDGGEKFGELKLRDNEPFWVDAVIEAPEGEAEFLPPEEQAAPPAAPAPELAKPAAAEAPKRGTGGELFAAEEIPFNLTAETGKGAAPKPKTEAPEQADLLGGAPPKKEEPAFEKPKVEERPLTAAEQEEFLELSKKARANREEGGPALTTAETQRYELLTALAGQKDFGFAEPTGPEAIKGKIKALASAIDNLDQNAPQGSGKKRQQYVEQRQKLYQEMRDLMDQFTEGQGEMVYTSNPKEMPSGYFASKQFRVRQLSDEEVQDRWRNPSERMEVFKVAGTKPYVAESRRVDYEDAAGTKEAGKGNWYAEGYGKTRNGAIGDARSRKGSSWSKIPEDALKPKEAAPQTESKVPESKQKYRIGNNPTLYTLVERLEQSASEKENNEQPVRVRNENTGKEEIVLEQELKPVKERSAAEKEQGKAGKRDLDKELRALGLDPSVFKTKAEKQSAIIRENQKKQGPGSPHITQPPDPKAQIDQLEEAFRGIRGRRVPLGERVRAMFDLGKKLAAAKDIVTEAVAGLKTTGDYLIKRWEGFPKFDDLLRAKGELSAEIEKNGWRMKHFVKTIERAVPDPMQRAAIAKWVGAGGDMEKLIAGYEEAPDRFKQHYLDAMDLNGDLLVGAMNIRNFFDSRLQEAIDAGVLKDGVEDYIHRIYEKTPSLEKKMMAYLQTGLLRMNPALAKKRIFDHDWEAERLGYNVVQDFLPRITEYEAALSRAIASRKFVRKIIGYEDAEGNKVPAMLATDGRPIIDVAGLGIPLESQENVPEGSLIKPSFRAKMKETTTIDPETGQPVTEEDPLSNRQDYEARNQYGVFRKWKWAVNDTAGNPIYVQGDVIIHPDYVQRFDKLLEPSRIRYAKSPVLRFAGRAALGTGGFVKQSMLDLSGFHQVQMAIHGAEHRVYTLPGEVPAGLKQLGFQKVLQDIDLTDPHMDGLLKGGMTLGGDYRYSREGLAGRSITRLIPGIGEAMESYHQYLFQDFIPRIKATMAMEALQRNMKLYENDLNSGRLSMQDIYEKTASQANAAFGELNQITLEKSKTMQDALRLILLAPDFLEARGRFALQALQKGPGNMRSLDYWKKAGPIRNNEQRMALVYGAMAMWGLARVMNIALDGQMHNEPENLFSVVYKGRSYGLRTVQGDILHLATRPVQFWMSRLNPVFGRTLLEMATGRDYFGRKRSALEQVWDAVSTLEPASIRHSQEHTLWESMMNAFGVTSRRFSDVDEAFKLSQKWKDKHGVGMKGEFIYDPTKDDLRGLKVALSNADEGASVKELQKLLQSKKYTLAKLDDYFDRYASMPLAGSHANDRKFIAGLTEDQKKTVQTAYQMKKSMNKLYRQAKAKYNAATRGPAPKINENEIDQPTPQVQ
jgi:hypothetical protein